MSEVFSSVVKLSLHSKNADLYCLLLWIKQNLSPHLQNLSANESLWDVNLATSLEMGSPIWLLGDMGDRLCEYDDIGPEFSPISPYRKEDAAFHLRHNEI